MDIILRLNEFLDFIKERKSAFYKRTGISNGYLNKVRSIGTDKLKIIINYYPQLNIYWLITGNGNMILSNKQRHILKFSSTIRVANIQDIQLNERNVEYDNEGNVTGIRDNEVVHLTDKIMLLENTIRDKESIIQLQNKIISTIK